MAIPFSLLGDLTSLLSGPAITSKDIYKNSFLDFVFPGDGYPRARLPMYENIEISESKNANLVTYDPVGRSSSLYSYAGASSRVLKLSFFLTFPHIAAVHEGSLNRWLAGKVPDSEVADAKKSMLDAKALPAGKPKVEVAVGRADAMAEFEKSSGKDVDGWLAYIKWWVNLIRSSVLNNQQNLMEGPPVIRLTHGPLYQNIPCICKSYNLSYDPNSGMDHESLLSRRIKVTMDLEEFRSGNFGEYEYKAASELDSDNVAGWEAIVSESATTDPGLAPIEPKGK